MSTIRTPSESFLEAEVQAVLAAGHRESIQNEENKQEEERAEDAILISMPNLCCSNEVPYELR